MIDDNRWAPHRTPLGREPLQRRAALLQPVHQPPPHLCRPLHLLGAPLAPHIPLAPTTSCRAVGARQSALLSPHLSGSPNSSWLARGRIASGAGLSASRNLRSGMKAEIGLHAESRLAPRTID
jgi:hypothetical protein